MANTIDLNGRIAVVTGGAQGIGRAIVERLLESGAAVAIWDRDAALAEKAADDLRSRGKTTAVACDVTRLTEIEARARRHREGARPHRHPGQQRRHRRAERDDLGVSDRRMARGDARQSRRPVLLLPRHRARMIAQNYGRIVNIASIAGKEGNPNAVGLFGLEGRRHRADQIARQGAGEPRHRGQLHHAGRGPDRDLRPDDASSTSTTCCRKSRAAVSSRWRRSPRSSPSAPRRDCSFSTGAVFDISGGRATY